MSATLVVLFNLKPDVSKADYEKWAKNTDLKIVRQLKSVDRFDVFETQALLGSDEEPPYQYVEIIDVNDMDVFGGEVGTDAMGAVAKEFQALADNPTFMLTGNIEQ